MYKKPPDEVPDGLSSREYQRLVTLYTLMGKHSHAARAHDYMAEMERRNRSESEMTAGSELSADAPASGASRIDANKLAGDAPRQSAGKLDAQAGSRFAESLIKLLLQIAQEDTETAGANGQATEATSQSEDAVQGSGEDPLEDMKAQLREIGLSAAEADEYVGKLTAALNDRTRQEPPPREVPENLSAQQYYELALRYKQAGWTEQARDALTLAIELDGDGPWGQKASSFLRSKIPRYPVPLMAEQLNIQGYNQMYLNEGEALRTFETLVEEYPDFEWSYGNLGSLLIKRSDLNRAEELLIKSVQINPYYINGWLHLSRVYAIQSRFAEADDCLKRVTRIDPDDPSWRGIHDLVEELKKDI